MSSVVASSTKRRLGADGQRIGKTYTSSHGELPGKYPLYPPDFESYQLQSLSQGTRWFLYSRPRGAVATWEKPRNVVTAPERRVIGDIIDHNNPIRKRSIASTRRPATMQQGHGVPSFGSYKPEVKDPKRSPDSCLHSSTRSQGKQCHSQKDIKSSSKYKDKSAFRKAEVPAATELFVIDRKGDQNAARYGPSKHSVPMYSTGKFILANERISIRSTPSHKET